MIRFEFDASGSPVVYFLYYSLTFSILPCILVGRLNIAGKSILCPPLRYTLFPSQFVVSLFSFRSFSIANMGKVKKRAQKYRYHVNRKKMYKKLKKGPLIER